MRANPYPTYEDAAEDYLAKFRALIEPPEDMGPVSAAVRGAVPAEALVQRAEEIAEISSSMILLAQSRLDSADPTIREGIRGHFIDQATVELLLGTELFQIAQEGIGTASTAAAQATHSAAFREAIGAVDRSSSAPVMQGIPLNASYRAMGSATIDEAASALKLAMTSTVSSIYHRIRDLGSDIAYDLVAGTQWTELLQGASLSGKEIAEVLGSIHRGAGAPSARAGAAAERILLNVYEKTAALLGDDVETAARGKIREWLAEIKQADRIELFDALVENLLGVEGFKKSVASRVVRPAAALESFHKASDLIKAFSDKFIVLTGRMRKLEDAIRLGKLIQVPQVLLTMTALQVTLLAALVYAGQDYIGKGLAAILQERGFWEF
jgi:ribosomal protein L12E/L44/L45/RPP1/RPP2